jgi:hypothetical protein
MAATNDTGAPRVYRTRATTGARVTAHHEGAAQPARLRYPAHRADDTATSYVPPARARSWFVREPDGRPAPRTREAGFTGAAPFVYHGSHVA